MKATADNKFGINTKEKKKVGGRDIWEFLAGPGNKKWEKNQVEIWTGAANC